MPSRVLALLTLVIALASCARTTRRTLVPDIPQTGSSEARARFAEARAKFLRDGASGDEFRAIVAQYPEDPIVPWAELYAGIAALRDRQFDRAIGSLDNVVAANADPGLTMRAELFLGIARNYAGDPMGALALLRRSERAIENDAERTEYLAALAYATAQSDLPLASLRVFDELYPRVTPTERALIVARVEEVVASAEPGALSRLFHEIPDRRGPSIAAVASRLAILAEQAGDLAAAARFREDASHVRAAVGLPRTIGPVAPEAGRGDAGLVGAVLPLGGMRNRVAEAAAAGLGLASGAADGRGIAAVEIRSAQDAEAASLAVEELARANVIAVVGPIESGMVDAAGARAESLGVPLLSLSTAAEKNAAGRFVFHMVHSGEARSRELARRALALGVRRFAILAPENGYGRAMSAAFADEVQRGGGSVVTRVDYKSDTKSFAAFAAKLTGTWDAVFAPAQADVLALIAPALAATGKVPRPLGTKKVIGGRPILLLSTAENLTASYLTSAGRHSVGALFAPGYYPDDAEPASREFLDRYTGAFGRAPGFLEAYAFDAAQLAVAAGAGGRIALASALARGGLPGLTGTIRFDAEHRRADPGVLYTVVEESPDQFAIRAAK